MLDRQASFKFSKDIPDGRGIRHLTGIGVEFSHYLKIKVLRFQPAEAQCK